MNQGVTLTKEYMVEGDRMKIKNKRLIILFCILIILIGVFIWFLTPVKYQIIGVGYKVGILKCPTGDIDRMPVYFSSGIISPNYDYDDMLKKNCKNVNFIY